MTPRTDQRRQPRLPTTCAVDIRDRYATWTCEALDVGPRGCLLVTRRPLTVGALLKLSIASARLESSLDVAGQVVWTDKGLPSRAGISFTGGTAGASPTRWFDRLVLAELDEALRSSVKPPSFTALTVYLGSPPAAGCLEPGEMEVVRKVGEGTALTHVVDSHPAAVRRLFERGRLTLARAHAVPPARWESALARPRAEAAVAKAEEPAKAPELKLVVSDADEPSPNVSRVLGSAVDALLRGDLVTTVRLLKRVQAVAPGDATSALILERIAGQTGNDGRRRAIALAASRDTT